MRSTRSAIALDPRLFGRGQPRLLGDEDDGSSRLSDDAKLFASTFAAGFLFVSILVA